MLIETAKIDHIWIKLKVAEYFPSLNIRSGYQHISKDPESRPKTNILISGTRIYPLTQKDQGILDLSLPSKLTQVRDILGLASYNRKFIPMFSSIVSHITSLTKKHIPFVWTAACQTALDTIQHTITDSPVLIYPDPNKQYHMFTDASNYTWSGVFTQTRGSLRKNGKLDITYHPITYQSGTFTLSQINWSTLVKEAYAIMYHFIKWHFTFMMQKWSLDQIMPHFRSSSKAKPKINLTQNWALEMFLLSPHITFQYIEGKDNVLLDSLSHLQCLGLYEKSPPEKPGEDYGITIFDEGETIQECAQPEDFTPPNPDMVPLGTDSSNEESVSDKHIFQVGDDIYEEDLVLIAKSHIQYTPHQINWSSDERHFISNNNKQIAKRYPS